MELLTPTGIPWEPAGHSGKRIRYPNYRSSLFLLFVQNQSSSLIPSSVEDHRCSFPSSFLIPTPVDHTDTCFYFLPSTHCFVPASNFNKHSLGTCRVLYPGKQEGKFRYPPIPAFLQIHVPALFQNTCYSLSSLSATITKELNRSWWNILLSTLL